jgi:hypothetical protein
MRNRNRMRLEALARAVIVRASSIRPDMPGWIVRRYHEETGAWESENDSFRHVYPSDDAACDALRRLIQKAQSAHEMPPAPA